MGSERSASRPGRTLAPGKGPPVLIVQEAGWAPEPVWTQRLEKKSFRLCLGSNLDRPVVQPVAKHYTAWATQLTENVNTWSNSRLAECCDATRIPANQTRERINVNQSFTQHGVWA
jgi:hypothetical protein